MDAPSAGSPEQTVAEDFTEVLRARTSVSLVLVELAELMLERAGDLVRDDQLLAGIGCRLAADLENLREATRQLEEGRGSPNGAAKLEGETKALRAMKLSVGNILDALRFSRRTCPPYQATGYDRAIGVVLAHAEHGGHDE